MSDNPLATNYQTQNEHILRKAWERTEFRLMFTKSLFHSIHQQLFSTKRNVPYFLSTSYHIGVSPVNITSVAAPSAVSSILLFIGEAFCEKSIKSCINMMNRVSRIYLTGVAAAQLQWHLSNMNVIKKSNRNICKIKYFALVEIND